MDSFDLTITGVIITAVITMLCMIFYTIGFRDGKNMK
jgi:hypothetical protein